MVEGVAELRSETPGMVRRASTLGSDKFKEVRIPGTGRSWGIRTRSVKAVQGNAGNEPPEGAINPARRRWNFLIIFIGNEPIFEL